MPLPIRDDLIKQFGGSTRPMMRAIMQLEKEGFINRVSPRKFTIASYSLNANKTSTSTELSCDIGLVNFEGHLYGDFARKQPLKFMEGVLACLWPTFWALRSPQH
jgi:hypothetical protein